MCEIGGRDDRVHGRHERLEVVTEVDDTRMTTIDGAATCPVRRPCDTSSLCFGSQIAVSH